MQKARQLPQVSWTLEPGPILDLKSWVVYEGPHGGTYLVYGRRYPTMRNQTLKSWLEAVNCYDVEPVTVNIGKKSFKGAFYKQDREPLPGAKSQESYTIEALYCVGKRPYQDCAYMIGDAVWYMAAYCDHCDQVHEGAHNFHFSIPNFLLMPCPVSEEPYSLYQELKHRHQVKVEVASG